MKDDTHETETRRMYRHRRRLLVTYGAEMSLAMTSFGGCIDRAFTPTGHPRTRSVGQKVR